MTTGRFLRRSHADEPRPGKRGWGRGKGEEKGGLRIALWLPGIVFDPFIL